MVASKYRFKDQFLVTKRKKCTGNNWNLDVGHSINNPVALPVPIVQSEAHLSPQHIVVVARNVDIPPSPQDHKYTHGILTIPLTGTYRSITGISLIVSKYCQVLDTWTCG